MANRLAGKGNARRIRLVKRAEAEERNENTAPDKRRSFWRERGFDRQSHASNVVANTVSHVNAEAKALKQRAEDWPMIEDRFLNYPPA